MSLKLIFFALLVAGASGINDDSERRDVSHARQSEVNKMRNVCDRNFRLNKPAHECLPRIRNICTERSTPSCTLPPVTTPTPTSTTTSDPCGSCRNVPISITDAWAGQCGPLNNNGQCNCVCGDVFCSAGQVIDRSTCLPNGRLQDCRCILTSTIAPTTAPPTKDPFVGCEWCLNDKLSVSDTSAGYCYPSPSESECYCLCADLFCQNGQIIDRSTCVNGGSMANCKCIDTSTPMPTPPTIGFQ